MRSIPARIKRSLACGSFPIRSVKRAQSNVTIREAFATESLGKPVMLGGRVTVPGAAAQRRLLVRGTHTRLLGSFGEIFRAREHIARNENRRFHTSRITAGHHRKFLLTGDAVRHIVFDTYCMENSIGKMNELFENLRLELRRGCLVLAVLAKLRAEHYGYTLRKALADRGMEIDENTLYPLLRRLESQGLLRSEWREEDKRNKRFYRLSAEGGKILQQLLAEWRNLNGSLDRIIDGEAADLQPTAREH